jgi:hypothetical protein
LNLDSDRKADLGVAHRQIGEQRVFADEQRVTLHEKRYDEHGVTFVGCSNFAMER